MTRRVRLTVAYDGSGFHGFWPNPGVETVGGTLQAAIERVLGTEVELVCAGRTDSGVHAWGQVVSFDGPDDVDLDELQQAVNGIGGPTIVVRDAAVVGDDFSARFSASARVYRYTILNTPTPNPFLTGTAWHVPVPLDLRSLRAGADALIGEHDFSSFCRAVEGRSLVRRVIDARWEEVEPGLLRFTIAASSFCHQMVRSVVGTLVEIGHGKKRPGDMMAIIRAKDRHAAGRLAPPHGLCLWAVRYGNDGVNGDMQDELVKGSAGP